jgi:hypothetical protein
LTSTERAKLETCSIDVELAAVVARNLDSKFDFLPVTDSIAGEGKTHNRIVGLIELVPFMQGAGASGVVRDCSTLYPLSEDNLIGADASILDFIRDADQRRCRLVISGHEISGLVSLSDLQRLPVRAALFGLVTHVEMIMANAIRREFNGTQGWTDRLSENRRQKIREEINKAQDDDALVDALLFTQFADKVMIIRKSQRFVLGRNGFENDLKQIQSLRDHLAHANDYAATRESASKVCGTVRLADKWSKELSSWPESAAPAQTS